MTDTGSEVPAASVRAIPKQARSIKNYHRVLDAADELFGELGVAETQMAQIITQSGVSAGSLYRFFPNKLAVAHALAERHRENMQPQQEFFAPASTVDDVMEMLDLIVDITIINQERNPGYQAIREVISVAEPGPVRGAREDQITLFTLLLTDVAAHMPPDDTRRMIEYVGVLIDQLTRQNPHQQDDLPRRVEELKLLLRAYVRTVLEQGPAN